MKRLCKECYGVACANAGVENGGLEVYATRPILPDCEACGGMGSRYLVTDSVAAHLRPPPSHCTQEPKT